MEGNKMQKTNRDENRMQKFLKNEIELSSRKENYLFRVYNLKEKMFYPPEDGFLISSAGDILLNQNGQKLSLKDNVVQRCTGVRDMKDQLIYQGDILRTNEEAWEAAVVWGDGCFCLEDDRGGFSSEPNWGCCEIIGTIFTMKFHAEVDLADEDEIGMDFWYACWNGDTEKMEKLIPSCKKFINRNIEFVEEGVRKTLCLPLIALLSYLRGIFVDEKGLRCLNLLLENGADPHQKCKDMNETPFEFAQRKENDQIPVIDILKKAGTVQKKQNKSRRKND